MDIRIGIQNTNREIAFESGETPEAIETVVAEGVSKGGGVLRFTDIKGKVYLVPVAALGYLEFGGEPSRRVGFVA